MCIRLKNQKYSLTPAKGLIMSLWLIAISESEVEESSNFGMLGPPNTFRNCLVDMAVFVSVRKLKARKKWLNEA